MKLKKLMEEEEKARNNYLNCIRYGADEVDIMMAGEKLSDAEKETKQYEDLQQARRYNESL